MTDERQTWYPLELKAITESKVWAYRQELAHTPVHLKPVMNSKAAENLSSVIVPAMADIVERDSLPALCHLLNGWGNAPFRGGHLLDYYLDFVRLNERGFPSIPQCEAEGDFHAGQSLAYALMAGVSPTLPIADSSVTLLDLMIQVQEISADDPAELGHFLFAMGWSNTKFTPPFFRLAGREITFDQVIDEAIVSHKYGHFNVCRKFHLTEGLCALATSATYSNRIGLRDHAQEFLNGQLETLLLVGAIHRELKAVQNGTATYADLQALREDMLLGSFIENEYYYVGHAAELYGLARLRGFEVPAIYESALFDVVNDLNLWLDLYLPHIKVRESFLHLGHYRRGITLLSELLSTSTSGPLDEGIVLGAFTLASDVEVHNMPDTVGEVGRQLYDVSDHEDPRGIELDRIVRTFNERSELLVAKGSAYHFRRIIPPEWPRSVHYEFLLSATGVSVDLHVELETSHPKRDALVACLVSTTATFNERTWQAEDSWLGSGFRLHLSFTEASQEEVTAGMFTLIESTKHSVDRVFLNDMAL